MENTKLTSLDKLQRIAVITPQFRIWTGETVLKATDFIIGEGGELPDSEFASLGRKALIDKQHLNVFRNLRDNFRKECGSIGLPFLGGFAVELSKLDELKPMLTIMSNNSKQRLTIFVRTWKGTLRIGARRTPSMLRIF